MKKKVLNYSVIIRPDARTGTGERCYSAFCPVLDVYSEGDTVEGAQKNIKAAMELALEVLTEDKQSLPIESGNTILTQVQLAF